MLAVISPLLKAAILCGLVQFITFLILTRRRRVEKMPTHQQQRQAFTKLVKKREGQEN